MARAAQTYDVQPSAGDHFSWLRTQMSLQTTLMSATRTAISLIGFGFTVAQFFEKLQIKSPAVAFASPEAPRNIGIALIAGGVITLVIFMWQYHLADRYLRDAPFGRLSGPRRLRSAAFFASSIVFVIGVIALISVLLRF